MIDRVRSQEVLSFVIDATATTSGDSEPMRRRNFRRARRDVDVSVGESVRIVRQPRELSQWKRAALTGIPQSTVSAIGNDCVSPGVERAEAIARALECRPAAGAFPGWDSR